MPFWNLRKKHKKRENRAEAQRFLQQTDVIIRSEKAGPHISRQLPSLSASPPPPSVTVPVHPRSFYPWSTQLLRPSNTTLPFPRYGHTALPSANGDTYVFGGLVSDSLTSDLFLISNSGNSQYVTQLDTGGDAPSGRVGHAMALIGDLLIVWGGDTNTDTAGQNHDDALYFMNTRTNTWMRVSTSGRRPKPRYGHTAIALGSRFLIFGGQADGVFFNDMWWIDVTSPYNPSAWVQLEPFRGVAPSPRTGHVAVEYRGQLFIFGGTDGVYHYNDTWSFDWNAQLWSELRCTGLIPSPREGHAATVVNGVIYTFGGRGTNGMDLGDLAAFTVSDQQWFAFQNMGPGAPKRSGHKMVAAGTKIYVLGGEAFMNPGDLDPNLVHVLDTDLRVPPQPADPT